VTTTDRLSLAGTAVVLAACGAVTLWLAVDGAVHAATDAWVPSPMMAAGQIAAAAAAGIVTVVAAARQAWRAAYRIADTREADRG
jgi:hypothetical protein